MSQEHPNQVEATSHILGHALQALIQQVAVLSARVNDLERAAGLASMRNDAEHPETPAGAARWQKLAPEAERIRVQLVEALSVALDQAAQHSADEHKG